jgi:arylsulfatase A-like enzyme
MPFRTKASTQTEPPRVVGIAAGVVAALLLSALAAPSGADAAAQSTEQQRCIDAMNKRGAKAMKFQGKNVRDCVRAAARGDLDHLGVPPQTQTAAACLTNDVRSRVAKVVVKVEKDDASRCLATPQQRPDFGYTGAVRIGAPTETASVLLIDDLFGNDFDDAIVARDDDPDGARCQEEVIRRVFQLADKHWKEARRHAKNVLKGKGRLTGGDPDAAVATGAELAAEIQAHVTADARSKLSKAAAKLVDGAVARCSTTATALDELFPGVCAPTFAAADLGACAARLGRLAFWRTLATFDALDVGCDVLDDGEENATCTPGPRNVVLILSDDQGWGDVGFHATGDPLTDIPTPYIDSIAAEGIELDRFFVQPVCSPTRAEILTGRSATRVGVAPGTINPRNGQHMSLDEVTLAEAFGSAGYTTGIAGKWHLGPDAQGPLAQGFDSFVGILRAAADYFTRKDEDELLWQDNGTYVDVPGYTTDLIADEAVAFIQDHVAEPFFLYVPFTAPHNPQQAKAEDLARVPVGFDPTRTTYAAMVMSLDDNIGRILDTIDSEALTHQTVVMFASDNGGGQPGNNLPLAGGKHNAYEGGVRVPAAIRIPGILNGIAGGMIAASDVYPTLLSLAGISGPPGPALDGEDVSIGILSTADDIRSETGWVRDDNDAYRSDRYKLIRRPDGVRELYDVVDDENETLDLAASLPATADALEAALDAWNADVGAAPSHVPLPATAAAPSGDVIRAVVDMGAAASGTVVQVQLSSSYAIQVHPGDVLEYDLRIEPGTRADGIVLDLERTNTETPWGDGGDYVRDQDNHNVGSGEAFTAAIGSWARRRIGLGSLGASNANRAKVMFMDLSPGRYEILLDNIVIRRHDGSDVVVYEDGPIPDLSIVDDGTSDVVTTVTVEAF